jgi:predicted DNA-binding transcriptional regulator AlpA
MNQEDTNEQHQYWLKLQIDKDALLTEQEVAALLNVTPRTLQKWRVEGGGPAYVRISRRCIRYRITDIKDWTQNRVKSSTSEYDLHFEEIEADE